jgi:hypothetical protein
MTWRTLTGAGLSALFLAQAACGWFAVPPGAGVTTVLDSQDNQFCWYAGPADQQEWLINKGADTSIRIKGWQDVSGLKFDLSAYRGRKVVAAELHLARANTDLVTSLVAATINADWQQNTACWRYRALPSTEWAFSNSDFSVASFGNYGSLVCYGLGDGDGSTNDLDTFRVYNYNGYSWVAMILDPALIQALMLDQYGLVVTDARWHTSYGGNPTVYAREQGATTQPRLYVQFATNTDLTAPAPVGGLAANGGEENGSAVLSFTAPSDPEDGKAFGYNVRYTTGTVFATATGLARWRIPRPCAPGTAQSLLIENLSPGATYTFFVQSYDSVSNAGPPASVVRAMPAAVAAPTLPDGGLATPNPTGKTVRTVSGVLRYFAASEVAKINPVTGNRLEDGYTGTGADDYKKANMVWDSAANTIALLGCRNEVVGAQLILQRLGASLTSVSVTVSDLTAPGGATIPANPNVELFQMHYVTSGVSKYAEAAIPLSAPFPTMFSIPDANHNAGGTYQSVYMDIFIPPQSLAGDYTGTVTIAATQLGGNPARIALRLRVSAVTIPDWPTFVIDLNGYGNPWDFGANHTNTCLKYFQVAHKHRAVPNTLPYGWNGTVQSDRCPTLTGNGASRHAGAWATFDAKYGRFFTSNPSNSAFSSAQGYNGPGANTPVTHFYTTFHEMWPQSMLDTTYGFDAAGRGPAYWDNLRAAAANYPTLFTTCPDVWTAFPAGYRQAQRNVIADWLRHASTSGWTRTAFEIYLNHKYSYTGTHALWVMEECEAADDFRAVGWFHQAWRDGQSDSGVTDVPWHFRIDISDRWGQHYGQLDNRVNWCVMGSGAAGWHWPSKKYRQYGLDTGKQEDWIWYGLGSAVSSSGVINARSVLQKWCQGFNGGLPYWNSYGADWATADDSTPCVVYSGQNVPGFGLYSGPIVSHRVKQLRQVQQIIELLNQWSSSSGMNRSRARNSLNAKYGQGTWDYSFGTLDEVRLYKLRADVIGQLEFLANAPRIAQVMPATPQAIALQWTSLSNRTYTVLRGSNLTEGVFLPLSTGLAGTPPLNVYTDSAIVGPAAYYRIQAK